MKSTVIIGHEVDLFQDINIIIYIYIHMCVCVWVIIALPMIKILFFKGLLV